MGLERRLLRWRDPVGRGTSTQAATQSSSPTVRYRLSWHAWEGIVDYVKALASRPGVRRVCEERAGANPSLPIDFVENRNLKYAIRDVSESDLAKAPAGYRQPTSLRRISKLSMGVRRLTG